MELVRWNPMSDMIGLQNRINAVFEDSFPQTTSNRNESVFSWQPSVDVYEKEDAYIVKAEVPGVKKEDLAVDLKERILTIEGERFSEEESKDDKCHMRERAYGKFQRSFSLPVSVDSEMIDASFKNGVLTVRIPKPEEKKTMKISIH